MNTEKVPVRVWKNTATEIHVIIPFYAQIVKIPIKKFDPGDLAYLKEGFRFYATVNLDAQTEQELNLCDFEIPT